MALILAEADLRGGSAGALPARRIPGYCYQCSQPALRPR